MHNIKHISLARYLAAWIVFSTVAGASEPIDVAVFDFLTPNVAIRSYQAAAEASPLERRPEPLMSAAQIDQLPENDRLAIIRREQQNLERWQMQKRAIESDRYAKALEENARVRDVLMQTGYGRGVLRGTPMMEAALGRYRDTFRVFRRRGGEQAQMNLTLEHQELGTSAGNQLRAPTHYIEGRIGDLMTRDMQRVQGASTITTRTYQLPVTISLHDMATNEQLSIYDELETYVDRAMGRAVLTDAEVVEMLLREATRKAAEQMYNDLKPAAPAGAGDDPVAVLRRLKSMLDEGLISQEVYDERSRSILDQL